MSKSGSGTDQKFQQGAWNNLNTLFGLTTDTAKQLGDTGKSTQASGVSDLNQAGNYWKTLLSGDRAQTMQAVAPAANAATAQSDAAKREQASMGTGRGGGVNAENQKRGTDTQAQIDTLIGQQKGKAAEGLTSVGADIANIGSQDISAMLSSLGIGESAMTSLGGQATSADQAARQAQAQMWATIVSGVTDLASAGIMKCWIAAELYGPSSPEFYAARHFIFDLWCGRFAKLIRHYYLIFGERIARWLHRYPIFKLAFRPLFDIAVRKGMR